MSKKLTTEAALKQCLLPGSVQDGIDLEVPSWLVRDAVVALEERDALLAAVKQAPRVTVLEYGTDVCSFCRAHPIDRHYAHCAQ